MVGAGTGAIGRYRTSAIGTTAEILVNDVGLTGAAAAVLDDGLAWIDGLASRFRPDSELSRLNASAGRPFAATADLVAALRVALEAARITGGLVTPMVGAAVCALGYDRDFEDVAGAPGGSLPEPAPVPDWRDVRVDGLTGVVQLPAGVQVDLGSTAKAWAADRIAALAADSLGCGVLVSLGGDVAAAGPAPVEGWTVALSDRCVDAPDRAHAVVSITEGGLATSGVATRTWVRAGRQVHHLVDPRTGLSARSCWTAVSVAASTCADANTAATAAMVMGAEAPAWLASLPLPALLVRTRGGLLPVGGWPESDSDVEPTAR